MKRYLVITADDFGFSKERNQGIVETFKNSAVKNASLLLNCSGSIDAVRLFKDHSLCSGLHLNVTEGHSLSKTTHFTLTNSTGEFWGKFELRKLLESGKIDPQEIKHEIECQIQEFKNIVGKCPAYVDGHQHIHVHPAVAKIFASTLHAHGIQVTRLPSEVSLDEKQWIGDKRMQFYNQVMEDAENCKSVFDSYSVRYSDVFVGLSTMGADMTTARLQSAILEAFQHAEKSSDASKSKSKTFVSCELMTHPGYATGKNSGGFDGHSDEFGCSKDREHEIRVLSSQEMMDFYNENCIHLVSHNVLCCKES